MMKKCNRCQSLFENCKTIEIHHYEVDTRIYETICVCPECGSKDFEEVTLCPACRERWIKSSEDFCQTCIDDATWSIGQIQRLTGCDWETARKLADHVLED